MHPLGGLDDHLHVVTDADVQFLVFDARYAERALQLAQRAPNLRLLSFGPQPGADDLCARAENFAPSRLVAPKIGPPDVIRLGYSGGTIGKPKEIARVHRTGMQTVPIMMAGWEWPARPRILQRHQRSPARAAA